ncbi:hypothetical protein ACFL5V_06625 [Fibrobacterota bacterium]
MNYFSPVLTRLLSGFVLCGIAQGIEFPDTSFFHKAYKVHERKHGLPVAYLSQRGKDSSVIHLTWKKARIVQVIHRQKKPFSNSRFSELASLYGKGAAWHEVPFADREKRYVHKEFPGIEQQWALKGYGGKTGWMGSGLYEQTFFLVFSENLLTPLKKNEDPLRLHPGFIKALKTSGNWIPVSCRKQSKQGSCYKHLLNSQLRVKVLEEKKHDLEIWFEENNILGDIKNTLETLTPDLFSEYARTLVDLSISEYQHVLNQISLEEPHLFNWSSWQLQNLDKGHLSTTDYLAFFKKHSLNWPYIPVLDYRGTGITLLIRLHFDGHYQMLINPQ